MNSTNQTLVATACRAALVSRRALACGARLSLFLATLVALAVAPRAAVAQPAVAQAQILFDHGRQLLDAGKIAEACAAFEASQTLDPAATTLLNIASCREKNHQLTSAWGAYFEAYRVARASGDSKLARVAAKHAEALKPLLAQLTIAVPAERRISNLVVFRDQERINPVTWNYALPIDAGTYTISASAPGRRRWSTTITIKDAAVLTVEIPTLRGGQEPAATSTDPASGAKPPATPSTADASGAAVSGDPEGSTDGPSSSGSEPALKRYSKPVTISLGAGAAVFGVTAIALKLSGDSYYDRAKSATTQPARDSAYAAANNRRHLAFGFGVLAAGCAGAAVYVWARYRREQGPATATLTPLAAPQLAGLAVTGIW
ncbi:MAG: hypothetical protein R3B48_22705 [Kofleriaceae bacterium]